MKLVSVKVNGESLPESDYQLTAKKLVLGGLPEGEFILEIETSIKPQVSTVWASKLLRYKLPELLRYAQKLTIW